MSARKNVNQSRPRALADDGADDAAGAADERVTFVWRSSPLLRLTTSAAPVDMLTLSGGGAECAWRRILGRLVRQRQPAALGTTAALAALSSRSV